MIYLKYGKKDIEKLKEDDAKAILESIVDYCVSYAGDSYSDFARPVIKLLVSRKLVEYGETKQIVRSDLQYIPLPIGQFKTEMNAVIIVNIRMKMKRLQVIGCYVAHIKKK